jgi:hypothetical protein
MSCGTAEVYTTVKWGYPWHGGPGMNFVRGCHLCQVYVCVAQDKGNVMLYIARSTLISYGLRTAIEVGLPMRRPVRLTTSKTGGLFKSANLLGSAALDSGPDPHLLLKNVYCS